MPIIDIGEQHIYYVERGEGDVLLLFPDNVHAAAGYERELEAFSQRFRVLAFDYPGFGRSTREVKYQDEIDYDLWGYRADLACHLLLELEIEAAYALGAGLGALAALHFAGKQAPQHRITPLGLIADSFLADWDGRTLHRLLDKRDHYYRRRVKSLGQQHGEDWQAVLDADTAYLRRLADRGGYAVPDYVLNAIPCPTLLTGHLQDPLLPGLAAEFARLSALIPRCALFLAADAGHPYIEHPLMWSDPQGFRAVVERFLGPAESEG